MTPLKPQARHLINIQEVRQMYRERTGNPTAARNTVSEWIKRRRIPEHGPNPFQRVFDRAQVAAALEADIPQEPQFLTVADAFSLAGLPYPTTRRP